MGGSSRSPARNRFLRLDISYFLSSSPSGSSFLMALNAVGATKKAFTLYSSMTRQYAPASGVRTGFPSYRSVQQPLINGA